MMHPFLPLELAQDGSPRARRSLRRAAVLTAGAALLTLAGRPTDAAAQVMQVRPVTPEAAAPRLGEHGDEVCAEWLGLDSAAIDARRREGALA